MSGETGNIYGHCRLCGTALSIREREMGTGTGGKVFERYCLHCGLVQ